jgi:hypothetical protein
MSQENVELVRRHLEPHEGQDIVPAISDLVARLGPAPEPDAVIAARAEEPTWRHHHPEAEWETVFGGPLDSKATGPVEMHQMWVAWTEVWDSYVYRVVEYRDLGEWVLTAIDVRGSGRDGIPVELRTFEIRSVRDGMIAVTRVFGSEREALEAAGLSE